MEGKICTRCNEFKPLSSFEFSSYGRNGKSNFVKHQTRQNRCKTCINKRRNLLLKRTLFEMYGSKCNCCGECDTRFLTLDHVQNDGFEQRKEMSQRQIISDAINSFNPSKYQILCYNCNCAKNANGGICPHKDKTLEEHLAYEKSITASHRQDKKNKTIQELLSKLNPEDLAKAISSLSVS